MRTNKSACTFEPAVMPMFTETANPESIRAAACTEAAAGRLIRVCSWCAPEGTGAALFGMENVSHGCCASCLVKLLPFMERAG